MAFGMRSTRWEQGLALLGMLACLTATPAFAAGPKAATSGATRRLTQQEPAQEVVAPKKEPQPEAASPGPGMRAVPSSNRGIGTRESGGPALRERKGTGGAPPFGRQPVEASKAKQPGHLGKARPGKLVAQEMDHKIVRMADLAPGAPDQWGGRICVTAYGKIWLLVQNLGPGDAPESHWWFNKYENSIEFPGSHYRWHPALAAGEEKYATFDQPPPYPGCPGPESCSITFQLDSDQEVAEVNESNNAPPGLTVTCEPM